MSTLPKVAWIGLGIMGSPMSENLLKAGYDVTGYTLERDKLDRLAAAGGTAASSVAEAVRDADVIVTMVPASPQVEAVAYGPDGILENARRGALLIDMSSITPQTSVDLAAAAKEKGIRVLDAPVSGGEAGAIEAVLSIMVGGDQADFDEAKPLFEALGKTIVRCGPHGSGQTVKAANQLIVAVNIQACAEAVVFLEKSGVDLAAALDVLGGGLAGSTVLARKKDNFLKRDFAGLPHRPAPQGHGHRHRRRPERGRRAARRRRGRPAGGEPARPGRRRARPLRAAAGRRAAVRRGGLTPLSS